MVTTHTLKVSVAWHSQVLSQLAEGLERERKQKDIKLQAKGTWFVNFLRPWEKAGKEAWGAEILGTANDW